jgi:hypothetical protein
MELRSGCIRCDHRCDRSHRRARRRDGPGRARVRAERAASAKQLAEFALRWEDERRELLTRIQHPNLVPVRQQRREPSEPPKDYSGAMRSIGRAVPPRDGGEE